MLWSFLLIQHLPIDYMLSHYAKRNARSDRELGKEIHTIYAEDLPVLSIFRP